MNKTREDRVQLQMVWPVGKLCAEPVLPDGYELRPFETGDEAYFLALMTHGEFDPWDEEKLRYNMNKVIPHGCFFVTTNGVPVATAMALHNYSNSQPFMGDVGWVVCHPEHRGKRLGLAVTLAVTQRFLDAGYELIQLHTEYFRTAALKTYFNIGYIPKIKTADEYDLWKEVCQGMNFPFIPEDAVMEYEL